MGWALVVWQLVMYTQPLHLLWSCSSFEFLLLTPCLGKGWTKGVDNGLIGRAMVCSHSPQTAYRMTDLSSVGPIHSVHGLFTHQLRIRQWAKISHAAYSVNLLFLVLHATGCHETPHRPHRPHRPQYSDILHWISSKSNKMEVRNAWKP